MNEKNLFTIANHRISQAPLRHLRFSLVELYPEMRVYIHVLNFLYSNIVTIQSFIIYCYYSCYYPNYC